MQPIEILLVEDNPGDIRLTQEALKEGKIRNKMSIANDGVAAMDFLRKSCQDGNFESPDLILLDLNLPRMSGQEMLAEIKADDKLKHIPVIILTTSESEKDILESYNLYANCYITKPIDLDQFIKVVHAVKDFWLTIVKLPPKG